MADPNRSFGVTLPSVCLSVRLSVTFWLLGLVYRAKSCTSLFLAGTFLYDFSETLLL